MLSAATYSIQQVSEITGLSKQIIRKWENRYKIIRPKRLDNGYRIYSEEEVQTLKQLVHLTSSGMTIKQAVEQYLTQIKTTQSNPVIYFREALVHAGKEANEQQILHLLEQAHHTLGIERLVEEVVVPFLHQIGELWCEESWGEYQEAISSQTIRDFLSHMRRHYFVKESAPLILGSCLPGEHHEIPMQILLIQCMLKGYRTIMLGPSPAPTAIQSIIMQTKPDIVLLTASTDTPFTEHAESVVALEQFAQNHTYITFHLGGAGVSKYCKQLNLRALRETHSIQDIFPIRI